jgi:hypothetical protein
VQIQSPGRLKKEKKQTRPVSSLNRSILHSFLPHLILPCRHKLVVRIRTPAEKGIASLVAFERIVSGDAVWFEIRSQATGVLVVGTVHLRFLVFGAEFAKYVLRCCGREKHGEDEACWGGGQLHGEWLRREVVGGG